MDKFKNKLETIIALVLLVGLGVFGFLKITAYLDLYEYNDDLSAAIIKAEGEISTMESSLTEGKLVFQETSDTKSEEVSGVLPEDEDLNSLTRAFDEFSVDNNFSNNPFFINSINYGESYDDGSYMVLPLSMKIESSDDNFYKFLEYIETSGNLDNQVRLMDVQSVSLSLSDSDLLTYSLDLNAYFQK